MGAEILEDGEPAFEGADGAHEAIGDRVFEAQRMADGDDRIAGVERVALAEHERMEATRVDAEDRQVLFTAGVHDLDHPVLGVIRKGHHDLIAAAGDHVEVRGNPSARVDDEAAPEAVHRAHGHHRGGRAGGDLRRGQRRGHRRRRGHGNGVLGGARAAAADERRDEDEAGDVAHSVDHAMRRRPMNSARPLRSSGGSRGGVR